MSLVRRFPENKKGRDFIIGDVHGEFSLVLDAMRRVNFDPSVDRLFPSGDLIDRGAGSHRCVKFLAQPYVFATLGNHEDMLISLYADGEPHPAVLEYMCSRNGFGWWKDAPEDVRRAVLAAIRPLPLVIEIETARGLVGIIHAEVPMGMDWKTFISCIESGDPATRKACLWGRSRVKAKDSRGVPGIGRVFAGHSPQANGMATYGNVHVLDTGAVFGVQGLPGGCLTMVNPVAATGILLAPRKSNSLIDVRGVGAPPSGPFGTSLR